MSAQPSDQIGGSSSKSSLFRNLRGSFSSSASSVTPVVSQAQTPPPPPASDTTAESLPPVALEQVALDAAQAQQEEVEQDELAPEPGLEPQETLVGPPPPEEVPTEMLSDVSAEEVPEPEASSQPEAPSQPEVAEPVQDSLAAAVPMAVDSMTDTLNPPLAGAGTAKEAPLLSVTVEHPAVDQAGGVQYVETERSHEMPPEVEGFLKKVEDNVDQIPQEIVISDPQSGQALPRVMATPVVVLPISPQAEEEGKKKSAVYSIRWLIEWSWKMMKVFSGKVVYREESSGGE